MKGDLGRRLNSGEKNATSQFKQQRSSTTLLDANSTLAAKQCQRVSKMYVRMDNNFLDGGERCKV